MASRPRDLRRVSRRLGTLLEQGRGTAWSMRQDLREKPPFEPGQDGEPEDHALASSDLEIRAALTQMACDNLRRIEAALGRVETASYGLCADCGVRIGTTRLRVLPFASRCRSCQEAREAAHRSRHARGPDDAKAGVPRAPADDRRESRVQQRFYAITVERKLRNPAVVAISEWARALFR